MPKVVQRLDGQAEFLTSQVSLFTQARNDGRLERFRSDMHEGWFKAWPEGIAVFGKDWKEEDPMTEDNLRRLGAAIEKRKEVGILALLTEVY